MILSLVGIGWNLVGKITETPRVQTRYEGCGLISLKWVYADRFIRSPASTDTAIKREELLSNRSLYDKNSIVYSNHLSISTVFP